MDARLAAFPAETEAQFRFLVEQFGFQGPDDACEGLVGFLAPPWQVWVGLDEYNRTVDTNVGYDNGREVLRAPLLAILTTLGLPAQWAASSAQTRKGMVRSLSRQAEALRNVMPRLLGADGPSLMARAAD